MEESLIANKAYTHLEVLLALVVLFLAMSFIFPAFFKSADNLGYLAMRYEAQAAADNLFVDAEKYLRENKNLKAWPSKGLINLKDARFDYKVNVEPLNQAENLYQLSVFIQSEGIKPIRISKTGYVIR